MKEGLVLLALLAVAPDAHAQQQIKSRVMVLLGASGTMGFHFSDPSVFGNPPTCNGPHETVCQGGPDYPGGDGSASYTDKNQANAFLYPGKLLNGGTRDGVNSRMYAAKVAVTNAVEAYSGDIDFGLMTFDFQLCPFSSPLCEPCSVSCNQLGNCVFNCLYTNAAFTSLVSTNWKAQGCGGPGAGGRIIVAPGPGSGPKLLPWIDGVEIHKDSGDGDPEWGTTGTPVNPELRAEGNTPLAEAIDQFRVKYYDVVKNQDPQIDCRPYVLVLATDAAEAMNVDPACQGNPAAAALRLSQDNPQNPVLTYVIGVATSLADQSQLNMIALDGGTQAARFANTPQDVQSAFADISAASVKVEVCNGRDDNCDGRVDEGFDKGAACTVGVGACARTGIKKCTKDGSGTQCCFDDGNPNGPCTDGNGNPGPLKPGAPGPLQCSNHDNDCDGVPDDLEGGCMGGCRPQPEICNGVDDDCDGVIDDHLVDVAKACGLAIGACTPGATVCENGKGADVGKGGAPDAGDHLVCVGAKGPSAELCDGVDNDCDGVVDGITRACYDGPPATDNVGLCHDGAQKCTAGAWGACVGEVVPTAEICNGLDDNCDKTPDNVAGVGAPCCPLGKCGVGVCVAGALQCSGGQLACVGGRGPTPEVCNGLDDDCDGKVDDNLAGLGSLCTANDGCPGKVVCDAPNRQLVCEEAPGCMMMMMSGCDPKVVGTPCGNAKMLPLPCRAGAWACKGDQLVCEGEVTSQVEVCNGIDDDCDGMIDVGATCPAQYLCYQGHCDPFCVPGEFPCPGGFTSKQVNGQCLCVPDRSCNPPCPAPLFCDPSTGVCVDPCGSVTCPEGLVCEHGACVGCERLGCPMACTRCDHASHLCIADKCCNVACAPPATCDPATGACVTGCAKGCPAGQRCDDGQCVNDPCAMKKCPDGWACDPTTGNCLMDACANTTCGPHLACCAAGGAAQCVPNPCETTNCPVKSSCTVDPLSCQASCDEPRLVLGAGGGGFGCAVGGPVGAPWLALLVAGALAVLARRRSR